MKIVFFGCGYLGYNLSEGLSEIHDVQVWGLASPYSEKSSCFTEVDIFNGSFNQVQLDFLKGAIVVDTMSLLSSLSQSQDEEEELEKISDIYKEMWNRLAQCKIDNYYFLSSGGTIYGSSEKALTEKASLQPTTLYAKSKVMLETQLQMCEFTSLILRVSNPYGGYQLSGKRQGVIPILVEKALSKEVFELWALLSSCRDYLYIDDMIEYFKRLVHLEIKNEILNLGSGVGVTLQELIQEIEMQVGKIVIEAKEEPVNQVHSIVLNTTKLQQLTNYQPTTTLHEGVAKEVKRIKEERL
ncbi:MAG: NAD-dependent epimerase/dehydratase family protein [Anaerorhabdus sp.]